MNVLLVTIDCLRRDRCGVYRHHRNTTPTLDALAREGFVFDDAYATGPVTTESFPGILAGRLSAHTVAGDNLYQKAIPDEAPTIASHLRKHGWSTVAIISNPRLGEHVASDQGFERFQNLREESEESTTSGSGLASALPEVQVGERLYRLRELMREFDSLPLRYELPFLAFRYYQYFTGWPSIQGEQVVDEFLGTLSEESTPFFAWTHLMDVHGPLNPQIVEAGGFPEGGTFSQFRSHAKRVSNIQDSQTELRYDSAVRYVDHQLGRIVDWLRENELWDETAIIVTADHGDALHDRGIYGHPQHYMYDELLNVPLVVRVPGRDGRRIERPVSLGWLHELVAELGEVEAMGAPLSSPYERHLPVGGLGQEQSAVLLADSISHRGHSIVAREHETKYVVQTGELAETDEPKVGPNGCLELDRDPQERRPLNVERPALEEEMRRVQVDPDDLRVDSEKSGIDEPTKDRLKQLGYVE